MFIVTTDKSQLLGISEYRIYMEIPYGYGRIYSLEQTFFNFSYIFYTIYIKK